MLTTTPTIPPEQRDILTDDEYKDMMATVRCVENGAVNRQDIFYVTTK